jgi:hypothetical protein
MQWIEALINVGALAGFVAVATCSSREADIVSSKATASE